MPTIITASAGHDFLALLPPLLGYHPRNSVVLVAFRGARTCGALRFDLPTTLSLREQRRTATTMVGMLCKVAGVDAVVPVAYTDESFTASGGVPHAGFMDVLVHRAELSGLRVRDALCEGPDAWASYLDPDTPDGGRSLALVAESPVAGAARDEGLAVRAGVDDGTEPPEVDPERAESIARAMAAARRWRLSRSEMAASDSAGLSEIIGIAESVVVDRSRATVEVSGTLLSAMQTPALRDVMLLQWAFDAGTGARVLGEAIDYARTRSLVESPDALLLWGEGPRPDPDRIDRAIDLLLQLTAECPEPERAAPFSMLAWLCWALGQCSRAMVFVGRAAAVDPDYGLAELIGAMIAGGRLPEWAFDVPPVDESTVRYATIPQRAS